MATKMKEVDAVIVGLPAYLGIRTTEVGPPP